MAEVAELKLLPTVGTEESDWESDAVVLGGPAFAGTAISQPSIRRIEFEKMFRVRLLTCVITLQMNHVGGSFLHRLYVLLPPSMGVTSLVCILEAVAG